MLHVTPSPNLDFTCNVDISKEGKLSKASDLPQSKEKWRRADGAAGI
jgi:hypothetical protein